MQTGKRARINLPLTWAASVATRYVSASICWRTHQRDCRRRSLRQPTAPCNCVLAIIRLDEINQGADSAEDRRPSSHGYVRWTSEARPRSPQSRRARIELDVADDGHQVAHGIDPAGFEAPLPQRATAVVGQVESLDIDLAGHAHGPRYVADAVATQQQVDVIVDQKA